MNVDPHYQRQNVGQ